MQGKVDGNVLLMHELCFAKTDMQNPMHEKISTAIVSTDGSRMQGTWFQQMPPSRRMRGITLNPKEPIWSSGRFIGRKIPPDFLNPDDGRTLDEKERCKILGYSHFLPLKKEKNPLYIPAVHLNPSFGRAAP
eukprot:Platyproteum_vivax@DN3178_c0_g1_i2.p2